MSIGLGLDTGGTFTDAVLIDQETKAPIAHAKSPTTQQDLSIGIRKALLGLPREALADVSMAALSTTLATNACVENKGGRAALILLGYNPKLLRQLAEDYGLSMDDIHLLPGAHGQRGQAVEKPDYNRVRQLAMELAPQVDALGIAEYWGVRNPEYEIRAKEIIAQVTRLPVAAAHELTDDINSLRRAATTLLNARLIPLTAELMRAVRSTLSELQIHAPLMIVRGDGALMSEAYALEHPVETLLSGPAASVAGGMALSGRRDCLVVDIGGTTTDIAVVRKGRAALSPDGVQVGRWRTGTRAVEVRTIGLGGDTRLHIDADGGLRLDVRRTMPLCALCAQQPQVMDWLTDMRDVPQHRSYSRAEFFLLIRRPSGLPLSPEEDALLTALADGPLPLEQAAQRAGTRPYFLRTERLEQLGAIQRCALTLTDLWHITGEFTAYHADASRLGASLLADRLGISVEELIQRAFSLAQQRLYRLLASHLIQRALPKAQLGDALRLGFAPFSDEIDLHVQSQLPLVGIGAPTDRLLPMAAERLRTESLSPEFASVGGAVGAITGPIIREARVLIRPLHEAWGVDGFACHAQEEMEEFDTYEEALAWSRDAARRIAIRQAEAMGAQDIACEVQERESVGRSGGAEAVAMLLQTEVVALASGRA